MPLIIAFTLIAIVKTEPYQEFSKNSNGMDEYKWVSSTPCETGKHETGYAFAPFGSVVLKQVNLDGSVTEPVCIK